jgi:hypothetical protein
LIAGHKGLTGISIFKTLPYSTLAEDLALSPFWVIENAGVHGSANEVVEDGDGTGITELEGNGSRGEKRQARPSQKT